MLPLSSVNEIPDGSSLQLQILSRISQLQIHRSTESAEQLNTQLDLVQNVPETAQIPPPDALPAAMGYPALHRPSGPLEILCNPDFAFLEVTALDSEGRADGPKWPSWSCGTKTHATFVVPSHEPPRKVVVVAVPGQLLS